MVSMFIGCTGCDRYTYGYDGYEKGAIVSYSSRESSQIDFESGKVCLSKFEVQGEIQELDMGYKDIALQEGEIVVKVITALGEVLFEKAITSTDEKEGIFTVTNIMGNKTYYIEIDAAKAGNGSITMEWAYDSEDIKE